MNSQDLYDHYIAEQHNWFTPRQPSVEVKLFYRLLVNRNNAPVLDIGSGSCADTFYLRKQGVKALAVDIDGSPDVYADLRNTLPFSNNFASAIFCRGVLHILSDKDQIHAIEEMHRTLQLGGLLYATFMISIFTDNRFQLITVDDHFGMNLDSLFFGRWSKSRCKNHGDHYHYFGSYIGYKL